MLIVNIFREELVLSTRNWHEPLREFSLSSPDDNDAVLLPKVVFKKHIFTPNFLPSFYPNIFFTFI